MNERETIYTHLNVFESFDPIIPEKYRDSKYVFLANINPDLQYNVVKQIHNPTFVAMDTMNFWIEGAATQLRATLSVVDALIINDSEVRQLSGLSDLYSGARAISEMGPKTIIIKKGEHGAVLVHKGSVFICPAHPVEELFDPTGAGDTFAGGFMGYLAWKDAVNEENLRRALLFATALASFCVEGFSVEVLKEISEKNINERVLALYNMNRVEMDDQWLT
jgi:sugar/nucleoside kinase (ribokinase family)